MIKPMMEETLIGMINAASDKELKNMARMQEQGFRLSSSTLNELGMEVQRHPCAKVSSRFSTPLLIMLFPEQEADLGQW